MSWDDFDLGVVKLTGKKLAFSREEGEGWALQLDEVAVIGEWLEVVTLAPSPLDHWWVFVERHGGYCIAPIRAAGSQFLQKELENVLGCDLEPMLFGTGLQSRIMWPSELRDQELFMFEPRRATGLFGWLRGWFCGVDANVLLSPAVQSHLQRCREAPKPSQPEVSETEGP